MSARTKGWGTPGIALLALALIGGCASGDGTGQGAPGTGTSRAVKQCKTGDTQVADEASCLQDDAACYPLASGGYCTGKRGNTCPAGSSPLPADAACAPGMRCFAIGESLTCAIPLS